MTIATHQGILPCEKSEMVCFVLDNGKRVISNDTFSRALGMDSAQELANFIIDKNFRPFISYDLKTLLEDPLVFDDIHGKEYRGYEAMILYRVCEVVAEARTKGSIKTIKEKRYDEYCNSLARIFAKKDIIPLIDEVTGYQKIAHRDVLQKHLSSYFCGEKLEIAKKIPDNFYKELFRLRNWSWKDLILKRPTSLGKIMDDVIFERLPAKIIKALHKSSLSHDENVKSEIRIQAIMHIYAALALMKAATTWDGFTRSLARAFPKK
ncbi:MAG: P63C domain-containing protein [Candidatus Omnitrophica bacterium]|nr:P63C domain-containing protein [Candidatus Omnitrophota bacterium]